VRVLLISSQKNWGGGEAWMLSTALGLARRGHRITLVCQPGSELAGHAVARGFQPETLRLRGDFDPIVIVRLYRLIRRHRIQMVCGNMGKEIRLAGIAARMAHVPCIRRRGSDMRYPNTWRHRLVDRCLVRLIIVNSQATRKTLLRGNPWLPPEKLRLIYNGIPLPADDGSLDGGEGVAEEFGLAGAGPVLGVVGLLKERKGHEILFQALPPILEEFPRLTLLVVGEGALREELEAMTRQQGIDRHVRFTGFRNDVLRLMGAMDILVLPSKNEGFGYVLAEAMSLSKPVVASRISSIPEVVEEGRTGLLVPPGDAAALRDALLELLRDPPRARRMGAAGRRRVERLFSLERMLDQVEELFGEIVGGREFSGVP
jgi:glycosyltransferase involved in cell wall biosynthesis